MSVVFDTACGHTRTQVVGDGTEFVWALGPGQAQVSTAAAAAAVNVLTSIDTLLSSAAGKGTTLEVMDRIAKVRVWVLYPVCWTVQLIRSMVWCRL